MQGLERYATILRLFGEERDAWTAPAIAQALGSPQSTVYRIVHELVRQNFLEPTTESRYRLGAAFIEYDRLIRVTDPFLKIGGAILEEVVVHARAPCVAVLARLYNDRVMCVASASSAAAPSTSYERGRPMPLAKGATSKAILAHLPARRLSRLAPQEIRGEPGGKHGGDMGESLKDIRKRGYCVSRSEIDPDVMGIGAPVVAAGAGVLGSLSLVLKERDVDETSERRLVLLVVSSAQLLQENLARL